MDMKTTTIAVPILLGALWLAGCGGPAEQKSDAGNSAVGVVQPTTKLIFSAGGPPNMELRPGAVEDWTLRIEDVKSGKAVIGFETVHERDLHLIVVSSDLKKFSHLHPKNLGNGVFSIRTSLGDPGKYKLYADYKPRGGQPQVAQQEVVVKAKPGAKSGTAAAKLVPDVLKDAWITKKLVRGGKAEVSESSAKPVSGTEPRYEVALMPMPAKFGAGEESILHFQVRDAGGKPLTDLQPYLGALGHCVVISEDTNTYLHTHPTNDNGDRSVGGALTGGPDVMFSTVFPAPGKYKAWGQFKHRGQVITASYVVEVGAGGTGAVDEHAGHSH